jgi:hypothetical protein
MVHWTHLGPGYQPLASVRPGQICNSSHILGSALGSAATSRVFPLQRLATRLCGRAERERGEVLAPWPGAPMVHNGSSVPAFPWRVTPCRHLPHRRNQPPQPAAHTHTHVHAQTRSRPPQPAAQTRSRPSLPWILSDSETAPVPAPARAPLSPAPLSPARPRFIDALLPGCAPHDMRQLLTYMHLLDVNDSGAIEWRELLVALRVRGAGLGAAGRRGGVGGLVGGGQDSGRERREVAVAARVGWGIRREDEESSCGARRHLRQRVETWEGGSMSGNSSGDSCYRYCMKGCEGREGDPLTVLEHVRRFHKKAQ